MEKTTRKSRKKTVRESSGSSNFIIQGSILAIAGYHCPADRDALSDSAGRQRSEMREWDITPLPIPYIPFC